MAHKYLNKIGIDSENICLYNTEAVDFERGEKFKKQRKKHGFDERETWDMAFTSATWLYEHLKMFKKVSVVFLDGHKFNIPVLHDIPEDKLHEYIQQGCTFPVRYTTEEIEVRTQGEAIDLMLEYLEKYILSVDKFNTEIERKGFEALQCAFKIYAEVVGAMWW